MANKAVIAKNHNNNHNQSLLNNAFNSLIKPWNGWLNDSIWHTAPTIPAANILEDDKKYKLLIAAPGLKKENFRIDVTGNLLTVSAEKEESTEEKEYNLKEYNYSSFSRSFSLPEGVKQEDIAAEYKDGQLAIILPKNEEFSKKSKSVKVR